MQRSFCTDPAVDYGTNVRIFVTSHASYVSVVESNPPASADVKLPHGKSAVDGLRQLIAEADAQMAAMANRTDRMRRALTVLERKRPEGG